MTLAHYLLQLSEDKKIPKEVSIVMADIATACKEIAHQVQRSGLLDLHGAVGGTNVHAEEVQKLDDRSNEIMKSNLSQNDFIIGLASEEEEDVVDTSEGKKEGYIVAFDPLDGSSNIDINMPIGTIFSVLPSSGDIKQDFLQAGLHQVAAGYVLYASSTVLVFSLGEGVMEFTLDPDSGDFVLTGEDLKFPANGKYFSHNESNKSEIKPEELHAVESVLKSSDMRCRYVGALVADFHRTLLKGGIFIYPEVKKANKYVGKLRMQYEVKPLSFVAEQAGGGALVNENLANKYVSTDLHQKVPFVVGDKKTVDKYYEFRFGKS